MPITISCPHCNQASSAKDEHAGKNGQCPNCQAVIRIPAAASPKPRAEAKPAAVTKPAAAVKPTAATKPAATKPPTPAPQPLPTGPKLAAPPVVAPSLKKPAAPPRTAVAPPRGTAVPPRASVTIANQPPSPEQLRAQIAAGFRAPAIERASPTVLYLAGILLTTLLMVSLPLIYLAIIGAVGFAVWWHLTHHHVIIGAFGGGKGALFAILLYIAPLLVGVVVIFFMFKPLFAPAAKEGRRRSLSPTTDPLLFSFVQRICALVGAAMPRRIDIDCQVNASASFRRGLLSLLSGGDLVLTIGLPLAAGLSLQQFAGVLAHEFGHFSQGAGMRLTYVIRSINFWFVRVVYQRDSWDQWLESAAEGLDIRIGWIIYVARACVWLTRKILWLLMLLGHLVAGFMLRQMEFDADTYETRVGGSDSFAATTRQMQVLNLAWRSAEHDLSAFYHDGRLVDDMPRLMLSSLGKLPPEAHQFVDKVVQESTTSWFDSHPCDKDRIAAARAENTPGVFHSQLPARVLFSNFIAASQGVTWDYYCEALGKTIDPKSLVSTADLIVRTEGEESASQARDRFFAGAFTMLRPLVLPIMNLEKAGAAELWREELAEARTAMESEAQHCREAVKSLDQADTHYVQSRQAKSVLSVSVPLQRDQFEHNYRSPEEASKLRDSAATEKSRLGDRLDAFETATGERLRAALMLLFQRDATSHIENAESLQRECRRLLPLINHIATLHASILELRNNNASLAALLGHLENHDRHEPLIREIISQAARVRTELGELKNAFVRIDYPFDHAEGQITVAVFLLKLVPMEEQIGDILQAAGEVVDKIFGMYGRAIGRLCVIAELVESDQGLSPL